MKIMLDPDATSAFKVLAAGSDFRLTISVGSSIVDAVVVVVVQERFWRRSAVTATGAYIIHNPRLGCLLPSL